VGQGEATRPPGWARALDERGKRLWRKPTAEERRGARNVGYLAAIMVNVILVAIVHSIPSWAIPFVTPAFGEVIPVIERSLVAAIVANTLLCAYDAPWFRHLAQVVMNAFALNATLALARIFPFDFGSSTGNDLARIVLLLATIGVIIAIIVEAVQMLLALVRVDQEVEG
jgi:hypothetical protein